MSDIKQILSTIENAVNRLSGSVSHKQEPLFREVLTMLRKLDTKGDTLVNNINNLRIINEIKIKVERLLIDDKYKSELKAFAQSYKDVQNLHNDYFSKFAGFNSARQRSSLEVLRDGAIETTITNLTETGLQVGVTDGLRKILQTNISAGGSYADLTEQLRGYMTTDNKSEGALERYVKTYSNTAINQFSAEYNKTIADDLGLEWYMYDGSLLETSRPFCIKCISKKYLHISEFETILRGDFGKDGHIGVSKSTGLPDGLMKGTDKENFARRRGGWNCGHQLIAVDEVVVPKAVKDAVFATSAYQAWAAKVGKEPGKPVEQAPEVKAEKQNETVAAIKENNKKSIADLEKRGIIFYDDIAKFWDPAVKIVSSKSPGSSYTPSTKTLLVGGGTKTETEYFKAKIMAHEGGHAMHINQGIITPEKVSPSFKTFYDGLKDIIKGKEAELDSALWTMGEANYKDLDKVQQVTMLHDTLGGLTRGRYGAGHSKAYYRQGTLSEMEVFAHSITLAKLPNEFSNMNETMKQLTDKMKEYALDLLK